MFATAAAVSALFATASAVSAAPLALYDTARDSTQLAPLAAPATCGGFSVACSAAPAAPQTVLPFDYGMTVSGSIGGSRYGSFAGASVSGWVKPKDIPITLYFDIERYQPLGRR